MNIDLSDDNFGAVLNCAVRYALGRRTYMPSLVQDTIRPWLPHLNEKTLSVMERDIAEASRFVCDGSLGDPNIDELGWLMFLDNVREAIEVKKHEAN